jgi:hypothetical protein
VSVGGAGAGVELRVILSLGTSQPSTPTSA